MSALYPQLLPITASDQKPPQLDTPPTYTDIFNQYFGDAVTPDLGIDELMAQASALNDAFALELPSGDADLADVDAAISTGNIPFDTSGSDALSAAWPSVMDDSVRVCKLFTAALNTAGMAGSGTCDAAATGSGSAPTPPPPGGSGGGTSPSPYPVSPNPGPNGAPNCTDSGDTINATINLPDAVVGQAPIVFKLSPGIPTGYPPYIWGAAQTHSGPSDLITITEGNGVGGQYPYYASQIVTIYPARAGSFTWTIFAATDPNSGAGFAICVSLNVADAPAGGALPVATPSTASDLLAAVAGQNTGTAVVDLGKYNLGAKPSPTWAQNTQWGYATSGVYTDGQVVSGPADMLTTFGSVPDPVSPGAYIQIGFLVYPLRVGTWAWLVEFFEDADHTIPVYLAFTATVVAPPS